tara:strand:+ start:594 stop:818 length:225 start_codon:yes stop_codon:yes gene_type:complete
MTIVFTIIGEATSSEENLGSATTVLRFLEKRVEHVFKLFVVFQKMIYELARDSLASQSSHEVGVGDSCSLEFLP